MHKDSVVEMSTHLLLFLFCRWRMNCFENNGSDDYEDDFDEKEKFRYPLALFGREQKFIPSRYRKKFFRDLTLRQRRVRCKKIPRMCLHSINDSAWRRLYAGGNDAAMITFTGLSHKAFECLNLKFKIVFEKMSPHSRNGSMKTVRRTGRKRSITSRDCLALNLAWTRTRGDMFLLSMLFGLTTSAISVYLMFGRRILIHILSNDNMAKVKIPSDDEIEQFKNAVTERHPALQDVWMTMEQSPHTVIQN